MSSRDIREMLDETYSLLTNCKVPNVTFIDDHFNEVNLKNRGIVLYALCKPDVAEYKELFGVADASWLEQNNPVDLGYVWQSNGYTDIDFNALTYLATAGDDILTVYGDLSKDECKREFKDAIKNRIYLSKVLGYKMVTI